MSRPELDPTLRAVETWLYGVLVLLAAMVVLGGLTRLTGSGLSIVRWDLVSGVLPPFSAADWEEAFRLYRRIPEYTEQNTWMKLDDFQRIFWWEWAHRLLGRLIGVVYAIPLLFFALRERIPRSLLPRLLLLLVLGALQGLIGWWMVRSGLEDRIDVSPYRLAVHLGLAFVIMGLLLDAAMRLRRPSPSPSAMDLLLGLLFLQIVAGAFVAGTGSGRVYTDWPLMNGAILPPEAFDLRPLWRNLFENHALVQFVHRLLAYLVLATALALALRRGPGSGVRWMILAAVAAQAALGVLALRADAALPLAAAHQFGAVVLFLLAVRSRGAVSEERAPAR